MPRVDPDDSDSEKEGLQSLLCRAREQRELLEITGGVDKDLT